MGKDKSATKAAKAAPVKAAAPVTNGKAAKKDVSQTLSQIKYIILRLIQSHCSLHPSRRRRQRNCLHLHRPRAAAKSPAKVAPTTQTLNQTPTRIRSPPHLLPKQQPPNPMERRLHLRPLLARKLYVLPSHIYSPRLTDIPNADGEEGGIRVRRQCREQRER